jgi:hypothetical protein
VLYVAASLFLVSLLCFWAWKKIWFDPFGGKFMRNLLILGFSGIAYRQEPFTIETNEA